MNPLGLRPWDGPEVVYYQAFEGGDGVSLINVFGVTPHTQTPLVNGKVSFKQCLHFSLLSCSRTV